MRPRGVRKHPLRQREYSHGQAMSIAVLHPHQGAAATANVIQKGLLTECPTGNRARLQSQWFECGGLAAGGGLVWKGRLEPFADGLEPCFSI